MDVQDSVSGLDQAGSPLASIICLGYTIAKLTRVV